MKIGLAIALRREEKGLTQEELAKAIGVSKSTICRWESGDISNMRRDRIQSLASALDVSPLSLLEDETEGLTDQHSRKESELLALLSKMSTDDLATMKAVAQSLVDQHGKK